MGRSSEVLERELELMDALEQALKSEAGIEIETDNIDRLKADLNRIRKDDRRYASLTFITPPEDGQTKLWIMHKDV